MSLRARQRRRRHRRAGPVRIFLLGGGVFAAAFIGGGVALTAYVLNVARSAPALSSLHPILGVGSSQVFAANGTPLGYIESDELRTPVDWNEIPQDLKTATIAIEDQRFYKNDGVDVTGIVRAAIKDITSGSPIQGGSTIAMQLVRNLYLGNDQHTLRQKIIEAKLAIEYEKHHSKQSILTSYLNSIPYGTVGGQTAVGVEAAARIFFDKPVWELNLQQSALLAGLPQAPSQYNPFSEPATARQRRDVVLAKMAELHYITSSQASAAEAAPLEVKRGYYYSERKEDFFFEYVRQQLVERYGAKTVLDGGLHVYTTIDLNMQRLARKAIAKVLYEPGDPASAIVTLDPANGDIEAMAESESYERSQYNLAADGHRQPGSTFKAIDLADALSRGVDPYSTYYDSHYLAAGWLPASPEWSVKTFGGEQNGVINLVAATLKSDNTVYAQLGADLGEQTITQMAYKMGVRTHLSSYPSEAIGGLTLGVTPLEMAVVYATLADRGWRNEPIAITKVVFPNGHVDDNWGQPHRVKVLSEGVTGTETEILEDNVHSGTAVRSAIACPTAAKTGTTSEFLDAWLDGYTPNYATVVWMGYPNKRVSMTDVHGELQQGGALPAVIWHDYMSAVTEGRRCVPFPPSHEAISYAPFYGHYAVTGAQLTPAFGETGSHAHHRRGGRGRRGGAGAPGEAPSHGQPPARAPVEVLPPAHPATPPAPTQPGASPGAAGGVGPGGAAPR